MPRPQFTLRALLVAILVVGAFFGGAAWQRAEYAKERKNYQDTIRSQDGTIKTQAHYINGIQQKFRDRPDILSVPPASQPRE